MPRLVSSSQHRTCCRTEQPSGFPLWRVSSGKVRYTPGTSGSCNWLVQAALLLQDYLHCTIRHKFCADLGLQTHRGYPLARMQQSAMGSRVSGRSATSRPVMASAMLLPRVPAVHQVQQQQQQLQAPIAIGPCSFCSRRTVLARSGKLGDVSLFGGDASSLLGGPAIDVDTKSKPKVEDVPLESQVGMDYTALRDALKEGDFRKADDETRALLIRLAGEGAVKRGWVYFTEVSTISVEDFITIDKLWKAASNNKFGYSVQREIFNQNQKRWGKFFKQIDWTVGENNVYRKWPMEFIYSMDAPRGHLPLTNALRGTQLFEFILNHPAWEKAAGDKKKSIDDRAKEAGGTKLTW